MGAGKVFLRAAEWAPGSGFRLLLSKAGGVELGSRVSLAPHITFRKGVSLADDVRVGEYCFLECVRVGVHSVLDRGAVLRGTYRNVLTFGRESYAGPNAYFDGSGGLGIGDFVHIGEGTCMWTHTTVRKALAGLPLDSPDGRTEAAIRIGNRCWIGGNVTVYPGVSVSDNVVILPHSVVTRDVESGTMVGGVPAVVKKHIDLSVDAFDPTSHRVRT